MGVRKRQKGIECGVDGCDNWCVSNGLCSKHYMAQRRSVEGGRAYDRKYNKRYKRPDVKKVCVCGVEFTTARVNQVDCSDCSGGYQSQRRHRAKSPEKVRARDMISKRVKRGTMKKEPCDACGREAESHHHNYSEPGDVVWLCKEHHAMMESY